MVEIQKNFGEEAVKAAGCFNYCDMRVVDSLVSIDFSVYDSSYYQSYEDGLSYAFHIRTPSVEKLINVHSDSTSLELQTLREYLCDLKDKLHPVERVNSQMWQLDPYFVLKPVKLDSIKFLPPKKLI